MLIAAFLTFLCVIFLLKYHLNRWKFYVFSWKTSGPMSWPIIGNSHLCFNYAEILPNLAKTFEKYGSPIRIWLGSRLIVVFSNPEDIETILTSKDLLDRPKSYRFIEMCLGGSGLLTNGANEWKFHRKILNSTVQNYKILNSSYGMFNKRCNDLIKRLESKVNQEPFDIYPYSETCTLGIVCETIFGKKLNKQENENSIFLGNAKKVMRIGGMLFLQPWLQNPLIFRMTKHYKILTDIQEKGRSLIRDVIKERADYYLKNQHKENNEMNDETGSKECNIMIDECLKVSLNQNGLTMEEILNESLTMLLAGFETTATSVANVVLMLAMHPEYQERVYSEIKSIFPEQNTNVTAEDLLKLNYTECFIKETMRLITTVPMYARGVQNDTQIGNLTVPAGAELGISAFHLHRNKNVWGKNADQFNPENFYPENLKQKHNYAFLPYGGGLRNCIGMKYANIVLRICICWLVRHLKFKTHLKLEELKFLINVTVHVENKHMITVEKRLD